MGEADGGPARGAVADSLLREQDLAFLTRPTLKCKH